MPTTCVCSQQDRNRGALCKPSTLLCLHANPRRPAHVLVLPLQVLRNRKGFVRLALQTGASLVPVLSYGETDTFHTYIPPPCSRAAAVMK